MFKTTLTSSDRQALMFVLVSALLLERYQTQREMLDDDHAKVLKKWVLANGREISLLTRARFLSISTRFYKQLVRTQTPDHLAYLCEQLMVALETNEPPPIAKQLMDDCTQLLKEHKLDS